MGRKGGKRGNSGREDERQLYTFVRKISDQVPNLDDAGTIVIYTVLNSLRQLTPTSRSLADIKNEEMRAVYSGLEKMVAATGALTSAGAEAGDGVGDGPSDESATAIYGLIHQVQCTVDPLLAAYIAASTDSGSSAHGSASPLPPSPLLRKMAEYFARRQGANYEDKMRRLGIRLVEEVLERRAIVGRSNLLTADYEILDAQVRR